MASNGIVSSTHRSEEGPQTLATRLQAVCTQLIRMQADDYFEQVMEAFTKQQLFERVRGAQYEGRRVGVSWSKSGLVEVAIGIERAQVELERDRLIQQLHDTGIARRQIEALVARFSGTAVQRRRKELPHA